MSVILATAGHDDKIRFWEAPSGICSRILRYTDSQVNCLEITPDKQYLAAGGNPHIRLFEINNSSNQNPILTLEGHSGNVTSLGFQVRVSILCERNAQQSYAHISSNIHREMGGIYTLVQRMER